MIDDVNGGPEKPDGGPDLAECKRFILTWFRLTKVPHITFTAIIPDGPTKTATFGPEQGFEIRNFIAQAQHDGRNIYFQPNETPPGCSRKASKSAMVAVLCRHADIDPQDDRFPMAEEQDRLHRLAAALSADPVMPPSVIIHSGNGIQGLWAVERELLGPETMARVEGENKLVEAAVGAAGTHDVSRLLRLPGTINFPNRKKISLGRAQTRAHMIWSNKASYSPTDVTLLGSHLETLLAGKDVLRSSATNKSNNCEGSNEALLDQLKQAAGLNPDLARRWAGDTVGLKDLSRSGIAFALGAAIKHARFSFGDMCELLRLNPHTAGWTAEKGEPNDRRGLHRIWDRVTDDERAANVSYSNRGTDWPKPAMEVLHRSAAKAPEFPLDVFGTFWAAWIGSAAEGTNAPPDYVAMPLLALASALIGNARWANAWPGWSEPPALWCGSVGNPSSGKSSGASIVTRDLLHFVEMHMGRDYPADVGRWQESEAVSKAVLKRWEKDVARALKDGNPVPPKPDAAMVPPKPVRPRASISDATQETIGPLLAGLPKGVLNLRDEMAGWLLNLSRYSNGGTDRPFWLEAYNGGPYQIDRQKYPVPIFVPHLTLSAFGTIQPDRLAEILGGVDDGLASRFLWAWPEAVRRFDRPRFAGDAAEVAMNLQRLANLAMATAENGDPIPSYVSLSPDAQQVLVGFGREMQDREIEAHGLLKSAIGKARGQALRLALVLEYMWWAERDGAEPRCITETAMAAATRLMNAYFLPMAVRVLGDAAVPEDERNARTLAGWIIDTRPDLVNISAVRDRARLPGLRDSNAVKAACRFLNEAHWLAEVPHNNQGGRPRGDYRVNPGLFER